MSNKTVNNAAILEGRLTLVSWFTRTLGYDSNSKMLDSLKNSDDSWGGSFHSTLERIITERTVSSELKALDKDIKEDWDEINKRRGNNPLSLKYFQYLAALASALFLHRLATHGPESLLVEINKHVKQNKHLEQFNDVSDLYKLAFWMATGSGKTLLMHLHYYQFMRYQPFKPDNILLITPNEELSRQHEEEMRLSGISCFRHGMSMSPLEHVRNPVRIIEITKLISSRSKRKNVVVIVPAEHFEGQNLLLVDEGHKGSGEESDEWFAIRDELVKSAEKHGFAFEYSATFGQAVNANMLNKAHPPKAKKSLKSYNIAKQYARSILVDYSYRYFHSDGYGKEFSVLNITSDYEKAKSDLLRLGNLLSFFQQQWVWEKHHGELSPYNLEKPLLLLLGATVTNEKNKEELFPVKNIDSITVLKFLNRVAKDQTWLVNSIRKILDGKSEIKNSGDRDAFADRLTVLKDAFPDEKVLATRLRKTLFYADAPGKLNFSLITQTKGEASLRIGGNQPFALVYVGEINKLRKLADAAGLNTVDDHIQPPMFPTAHLSESPINILIGAKKFMEGWSSWRVSSMGLLNVGTSEGTQIIQLFGRGIRLKGKNLSLKRSTPAQRERVNTPAMKGLQLLETLNIFAINAEFMSNFREYLEREGMSSEPLTIEIVVNKEISSRSDIQSLKMPLPDNFKELVMPELFQTDKEIVVTLDYGINVQSIHSETNSNGGMIEIDSVSSADEGKQISDEYLKLLDFDRIYRRLLVDKHIGSRTNLVLPLESLPEILQNNCRIIADDETLEPKSYRGLRRLHDIAYSALRKFGGKLYYRALRRWQTQRSEYTPLFENDEPSNDMRENFAHYEIRVDKERLVAIQNLIDKNQLLECGEAPLFRIAFDRHLYLPLLLEQEGVSISPPGLNKYEKQFVQRIKGYIDGGYANGKEVFLLRNNGRGKGVGFFEDEGFYPDFLLWVIDGNKQRIVFVEPHGMRHALAYKKDFKANLWERMKEWENLLSEENISLDSFIISTTKYNILKDVYGDGNWTVCDFKSKHILFFENDDLIQTIINGVS